jgi:hypothetical protein
VLEKSTQNQPGKLGRDGIRKDGPAKTSVECWQIKYPEMFSSIVTSHRTRSLSKVGEYLPFAPSVQCRPRVCHRPSEGEESLEIAVSFVREVFEFDEPVPTLAIELRAPTRTRRYLFAVEATATSTQPKNGNPEGVLS